MRALSICAADLRRARDYVVHLKDRDIEKRRIFWRGDRIEWLLARGFHPWFFNEIKEDRVAWPGPGIAGTDGGGRQSQSYRLTQCHVRYWHLADIKELSGNVRFWE